MVVAFHKVIIVEEDPVEAEILEFYLDRAGVEAVTVRTTQDALPHVDPSTPYGVLTEAKGESIDWQELAQATLGYPSIFMVLSDAPLSREQEFEAMRLGVCEVFVKPVEPKAIVEILRLSHPVPLGSGSVGVPAGGFGGDLRTHHAQKLLQFSRRHHTNALIEIEMGAQFGGILVRNGQPIDAWIEGFRGRSALNAILMLEEAPFVYFPLEEGSEELRRPNVIGTDGVNSSGVIAEAEVPHARNVTHDDTPALAPATPPPVPATAPKKKKRRRFSKTGGTLRDSQVTQQAKKPLFADTMVEETNLDDLQVTPARDRKEVVALSPNDTLVSAPPPVPPQPAAQEPPPLRPRRNTTEAVATATVAHVQFSEDEASIDNSIPVLASEDDFFQKDLSAADEFGQELEEWEEELRQGDRWHQSPALAKVLFVAWLLLAVFVGWNLTSATPSAATDDMGSDQEVSSQENKSSGLQLMADGSIDQAHEHLVAALKDSPKDVQALTGLALIAFDKKNFTESKRHFLALLEEDDSLHRAHWYLGYIAKQVGNKEDMKRHWQTFVGKFPNGKHAEIIGSELE